MFKFFAFLLAGAAPAFATVISDTNISLSGNAPHYTLTVFQDAARTDFTSIQFDVQGQNLIFRNYNLDEGSDWYFAGFNNSFSAASIFQGTFTAFNQIGQSYDAELGRANGFGPGAFYLGVNTGNGRIASPPYREVFGWALLRSTVNGFELLGSAMTYDSPGIIIGTTQTVPEPAPAAFCLLPILGALFGRRRDQPAPAWRS